MLKKSLSCLTFSFGDHFIFLLFNCSHWPGAPKLLHVIVADCVAACVHKEDWAITTENELLCLCNRGSAWALISQIIWFQGRWVNHVWRVCHGYLRKSEWRAAGLGCRCIRRFNFLQLFLDICVHTSLGACSYLFFPSYHWGRKIRKFACFSIVIM